MSKYWDGRRFEDGSKAYVYLKIWKHMPERCPRLARIRRKMWIAKCRARDLALDKQYSHATKND